MKRSYMTAILFILVLAFGLTACGKAKNNRKLPPGRRQRAGRYCPRSREMPKKQQTCIKS